MSAKVAGVVVLYDPPEAILVNVESYRPALEILYVFDNSPHLERPWVGVLRERERVRYLTTGRNVGVAAALNRAAGEAIKAECDYLLTMDQDSFAVNGMTETMLSVAQTQPSLGIISPFYLERNAPKQPPEQEMESVVSAMTSGSLVRLEAYRKVGGFLEDLFVDYVDVEYCLRLQMSGFAVVRANRAVVSHTVGNVVPRRFFGKVVYPTNHSPERFFHQARNRIYVRKRYRRHFPEYFRHEAKVHRGRLIKMLLYEKRRGRKIVAVVKGMIAGLRGDFSPISMT